jgi:hypothetical protein
MKEYVTILHEVPRETAKLSPREIQGMIERYMEWTRELREQGRIVAEKSLDSGSGKVIRGSGAKTIITEGPYAESKEVIGGLHIIKAASFEEAVRWAETCPALDFGGAVEVREVTSWEG